MKAPIAAILFVLAAACAFAQTLAPELAPAAAKYKADIATLEAQRLAALAQAQKSHAAALDAAEKTATASGNLPAVIAITKEREALTGDSLTPNFPDGLPKNLQTTRKAYLDAAARIRVNEAARRAAIAADYLRALASLQSKTAANPELAQQIAAEKGKLLAITATPTAPVPVKIRSANLTMSSEPLTWEQGLEWCAANRVQMISYSNWAEAKTREKVNETIGKNGVWIGLSYDFEKLVWKDLDGSVISMPAFNPSMNPPGQSLKSTGMHGSYWAGKSFIYDAKGDSKQRVLAIKIP